MGNITSFPESHLRIYKNLLSIKSSQTRAEMIQTLLAGPEYVASFRSAGIYSDILQYLSKVRRGENPGLLPNEQKLEIEVRKVEIVSPYDRLTKAKSNDKALSYFQMSLQVLGLEEEVALTDALLKKAYKKAAVKAHPDKAGGSEKHFEAVTRAYAYLSEILKRIQGGRATASTTTVEPTALRTERTNEAKQWEMKEPVRLNPDKLDMSAFNTLFEQTKMREPDEDGYGDWLKEEVIDTKAQNFSGKFNRDVFHKMFEDEVSRTSAPSKKNVLAVMSPQALLLAPRSGVELGREKPDDYTAPSSVQASNGMQYTDLRAAYTTANTFSGDVADVQFEKRDFGQYQESRKKAPPPLTDHEMAAIYTAEKDVLQREKARQIRAADELIRSDEFHENMKRMVLTDKKARLPDTRRF